MNYVELDFSVGVKRWRTRAVDRIEWVSVVRIAKAKLKLEKKMEEEKKEEEEKKKLIKITKQ